MFRSRAGLSFNGITESDEAISVRKTAPSRSIVFRRLERRAIAVVRH
jgi:hypothetical protein